MKISTTKRWPTQKEIRANGWAEGYPRLAYNVLDPNGNKLNRAPIKTEDEAYKFLRSESKKRAQRFKAEMKRKLKRAGIPLPQSMITPGRP